MKAVNILLQTGAALPRVRPDQAPDWSTEERRNLLKHAITCIRTVEHDFEVHITEEYTYLNECTLNIPTDRLNTF
eukprot:13736852-Alexandrium_andersonii.AAC.1